MRRLALGLVIGLLSISAWAAKMTVPLYHVAEKGYGEPMGKVTFVDTQYGMLIKPNLFGLKPGLHGFHAHQVPNCDHNGLAAKGHFDPAGTGKHLGPYSSHGHLGDLPVLYVSKDGHANVPTLAPRLEVSQLKNRALIVHADGDNYSDEPKPLGGGGARVACSVIR